MAKKRVSSAVLFVIGIGLFYFGYQISKTGLGFLAGLFQCVGLIALLVGFINFLNTYEKYDEPKEGQEEESNENKSYIRKSDWQPSNKSMMGCIMCTAVYSVITIFLMAIGGEDILLARIANLFFLFQYIMLGIKDYDFYLYTWFLAPISSLLFCCNSAFWCYQMVKEVGNFAMDGKNIELALFIGIVFLCATAVFVFAWNIFLKTHYRGWLILIVVLGFLCAVYLIWQCIWDMLLQLLFFGAFFFFSLVSSLAQGFEDLFSDRRRY